MRPFSHAIRVAALLLAILGASANLCSRPPAPQAPAQTLTLREYIAQLDRASAALSENDPAVIHSFRGALPAEWVVQGDDGQSSHVKTAWLASALAALEKDPAAAGPSLEQSRRRLAALRQAAAAASAAPAPDASRARAQIDRILNGGEFRGAAGPSWLDVQKARLFSWIARHLQSLFSHIGVSRNVGNLVAWALISLAALLLAFWAVGYLLGAGARPEIDLHGVTPAGQDGRFWAREAQARAERGDYRGAIHAAYWAAVARLEEANLLPEDRARTPRESLRLVRSENAAYAPLLSLTRRFEITWYGYRAATADDWSDAKQQLETLECLRSSTPAIAAS